MVLRCCLNNIDALRAQAIIVDTIAVIIPPAISNGKCCAKYMREQATQQASINKNNFNHLYFVIVTSKNIDAPALIKQYIAPLIKGGGGGQKTFASAGGTDVNHLDEVIVAVKGLL